MENFSPGEGHIISQLNKCCCGVINKNYYCKVVPIFIVIFNA
ncbi:hypothetical protein BDE36_3120 [Arcticibacter tournemirensis]|nr:hypothetical protein BDE36_3120 [Arcticibacter tournemirensis]